MLFLQVFYQHFDRMQIQLLAAGFFFDGPVFQFLHELYGINLEFFTDLIQGFLFILKKIDTEKMQHRSKDIILFHQVTDRNLRYVFWSRHVYKSTFFVSKKINCGLENDLISIFLNKRPLNVVIGYIWILVIYIKYCNHNYKNRIP